MYYVFQINFNRAQQQIDMNTASIRNILFLMKSTEILNTIMYSSMHIKAKTRHVPVSSTFQDLKFIAGHIAAMVTYCATKLTATCSPMTGQFVDIPIDLWH